MSRASVQHLFILAACHHLEATGAQDAEEVVRALGVRVTLLEALHFREVEAWVEQWQRAVVREQRPGGLVLRVAHAEAGRLGAAEEGRPGVRHREPVPDEQPAGWRRKIVNFGAA